MVNGLSNDRFSSVFNEEAATNLNKPIPAIIRAAENRLMLRGNIVLKVAAAPNKHTAPRIYSV